MLTGTSPQSGYNHEQKAKHPMNNEEQVTSLELSKKLKELGVKQESLWYWWKSGHIFVEEERYAGKQWEKLASALTVAELGGMFGKRNVLSGYIPRFKY